VRRELDLLVPPLGGPVVAGDQAHAVQPPEVAVDERVPRLRLVGDALRQPQVPEFVVGERMRLQERVLLARAWLRVLPARADDVTAGVDQLLGVVDGVPVDGIGGQRRSPQDAVKAYRQNSRMSGGAVGEVIATCVKRIPTVPVAGRTCPVVPVPPTQP
jgi:hypothetical protein